MPVIAVPAIALLAIAIVALILIYALEQLVRGISFVFPSVSVPFLGSLRNVIVNAITGAVGLVKTYAMPMLAAMGEVMLAPVTFAIYFIQKGISIVAEINATLHWIVTTGIVRAENAAIARANTLYNQAISFATANGAAIENDARSLYNSAIAHTDAAVAAVENDARSLYNQAIAFATTNGAAIEGDVRSLYNQAIAFATQNGAAIENDVRNLYSAAVAHADAVGAQVEADARTLAGQAETLAKGLAQAAQAAAIAAVTGPLVTDLPNIWPAIENVPSAIAGAAAGGFADVQSLLKGLDLSIPTSIGGTLAVTVPIVSALSRLAVDCTIPNCRNLSQFGKDLQALLSLFADGALIAFFVEMVTDPEGAARLIVDDLGPIANSAVNAAKSLVGVG
jgi:hypothetical protein